MAAKNVHGVARFCPKSTIYDEKWQFLTVRTGAFDPVVQLRLVTGGGFKLRRLLEASEARLCSAIERIAVGEGLVAAVG